MRWLDALSLFAIGLVVVLVSVPRLRALALRSNEDDAWQMIRLLGQEAFGGEVLAAPNRDLGQLVDERPGLAHRLDDTEVLQQGRVLRRHGYLFDLIEAGGRHELRAWPWRHGRTGVAAFVFTDRGELFGHPNPQALWSGLGRPPAILHAGSNGVLDEDDRDPGDWRRLAH